MQPLIDRLAEGTFNFLEPTANELRRLVPELADKLPRPRQIHQRDDLARPLTGFAILQSQGLTELETSVLDVLAGEEEAQITFHSRDSYDSRALAGRWETYRQLLGAALENVIGSSYGDDYPALFWLCHSVPISAFLKELPRRLRRNHHSIGRDHGDAIKYRVFEKWSAKVTSIVFDLCRELEDRLGEPENRLMPQLLPVMRDNVLIFTEDHVSPDLMELGSYFHGCLGATGRDLRPRLKELMQWHADHMRRDPVLRSAWRDLCGEDPDGNTARLPRRPGYMAFLASHPAWDPQRLPTPEQIRLWEGLLGKLKEFELFHALRRMIVRLEAVGGALVCRDRSTNTTWVGGPPVLTVSDQTRPIDFARSWVVDPLVRRYGLVYDISEFSSTLSLLGLGARSRMDEAFQMTFGFQRRINGLARRLRLRLEKYLGDGAFYSGLDPRPMLVVAISLQRAYRDFLEDGYPFDKGLRMALNHGEYRLLPLEAGTEDRSARYEFFGHGLVELSRLTTGKKTQELDEFKTYLIGQGYPEPTVNKFFGPILSQNADLVSRDEEDRQFYAYINPNNTLINEGIVATEPYLEGLGSFEELRYVKEQGRGYIVFDVREEVGGAVRVGVRKLGLGKFKGLEPLPVYEIVDGEHWSPAEFRPVPAQPLLQAVERVFASFRTSGRV